MRPPGPKSVRGLSPRTTPDSSPTCRKTQIATPTQACAAGENSVGASLRLNGSSTRGPQPHKSCVQKRDLTRTAGGGPSRAASEVSGGPSVSSCASCRSVSILLSWASNHLIRRSLDRVPHLIADVIVKEGHGPRWEVLGLALHEHNWTRPQAPPPCFGRQLHGRSDRRRGMDPSGSFQANHSGFTTCR